MGVIPAAVHLDWLQTHYLRFTPILPDALTWVSTSVSLRVCSADWLRRLVPISSMAAVWVCTAVLFISSIPERTFSWMKFSSCTKNKETLEILSTMLDCGHNHIVRGNVPITPLSAWCSNLEVNCICHLNLVLWWRIHFPQDTVHVLPTNYPSVHLQVYLRHIPKSH